MPKQTMTQALQISVRDLSALTVTAAVGLDSVTFSFLKAQGREMTPKQLEELTENMNFVYAHTNPFHTKRAISAIGSFVEPIDEENADKLITLTLTSI